MKKRRSIVWALTAYFAFFAAVALVVTFTVIIYDRVRTVLGENVVGVSLVMFAVCLALSLFCYTADAFRRKLTVEQSVEQILEATERITAGDFRVRLTPRHDYRNYDDLDRIMQNLNEMTAELSKNEVLKSDFISNVSHEIKTPLAIIRNYATALQNEALSREDRNRYVDTLVQASARLNDLVMNILRLNKLEHQKISPEREEVRLDEMLAQTVFAFEEPIEKKGLELDCDIDEVSIVTSPSYLEIVWNNLLSNAVKFTPEGGKISISLHAAGGKAVVRIADTGCGMDRETGRHIFDKFYQGDTSHAAEGNGLGLALVKKVIDVLGGEIAVESAPGKGTAFMVSLDGGRDEKR